MSDDRAQKDWSQLTAPRKPGLPWDTQLVLALSGVLLTIYVLLMTMPRIPIRYRPYQGIVGVPAAENLPTRMDLYLYVAGVLLSFALGRGLLAMGRRARSAGVFAWSMLILGIVLLIYATQTSPSSAVFLIGDLLNSPKALLQLLAGGVLLYYMGSRPKVFDSTQALKRTPSETYPGLIEVSMLDRFSAFCPLLIFCILILTPALPSPAMALLIAHPLALIMTPCFYPPRPNLHPTHRLLTMERLIWGLMLALPVPYWYFRLGRSLGWQVPSFVWIFPVVTTLAVLAVVLGYLRLRRAVVRPFDPRKLMPWFLLAMVILSAGYSTSYDPFHQGERIFAPHAAQLGASAFTDIFYVHGYGVNTWLGWFGVPPNPAIHSIDNNVYGFFAGLCMALLAFILHRLFGANWWPLTFAISLFGLLSSGLTGGRFLPLWIALWMVLEYQRSGRGRWMTMLGLFGWLSLYFSLDTGFITVVSSGAWALCWGWLGLHRKIGNESAPGLAIRMEPFVAWGIGVVAGLAATSCWLWTIGALENFWTTFFDYLSMKHHYDKLPFFPGQLTLFIGPAVVLGGLFALDAMRRARESSDLAAAIYFLLPAAFITLTRGLDRADTGHMIYATLPAWPLLGCLLVWRTRGEVITHRGAESISLVSEGSKFTRAAVFFAFLAMLPYTHPLIRGVVPEDGMTGEPDPVPRIDQIVEFNLVNPTLPLCGPIDDPYREFFFAMCAELKARLKPGTYLLDFANQPALYPWANLRSPSRFYAAFYMAGIGWQDEVVRRMEATETQYVLWQGPDIYWNAPDGIPNYIRQWWVARHILAHYRPAWLTVGGGLIAEPNELAKYVRNPVNERVWRRPVDLKKLPYVIGQNQQAFYEGTPENLERMNVRAISLPMAATYAPRRAGVPVDLLQIEMTRVQAGELALWFGKEAMVARPDRPPDIRFTLFKEPGAVYLVPLSSIPAWVWGDSNSIWIEAWGE